MITGHVPAVRLPPDYAADRMIFPIRGDFPRFRVQVPRAGAGRGAQACLGGELAGLGLGDPPADGGVGSGVERGPVLGELLVAGADLFPQADQFARDGVVLAGGQGFDRGGQPGGVE